MQGLAAQTHATLPHGETTKQELLVEFGERLNALRAGTLDHDERLQEVADLLASQGRPDAVAVADFYLALSRPDRQAGLAGEGSFFEIRARIQGAEQLRGENWRAVRAQVQQDLQDLIEVHGSAPDGTPAARGHALLARLLVNRLDRDGTLGGDLPRLLTIEATDHAEQAIQLFERAGQRTPQLEPIWLLGELHRLQGQAARSHARYENLSQLAAFTAREDYGILALRGLVCLAREAGDTRGVAHFLQRWGALQTPQESWELAREHALWLLASDQARSALTFLWNCKPTDGEHALQWQALSCAALRRRGHLAAARRTLESIEREFPGEWELLTLTGAQQLLAEGHHADAEDSLQAAEPFAGWSAQGRVQALALLGETRLAQGQAGRALAPLRRALREAHHWESRRLGPGSVSGEWLGLHAVVLAAQAAAESGDALLAATLLEENQARHLGRALHNSLESSSTPAGPRQALLARRSEGAGVMTFAFGAEFGISVHLGPDGQSQVQRIELSRSQIQRAIMRIHQAIARGEDARAQGLAHELSASVLEGIGAWAFKSGTSPQRLRLILHGPLAEMPISALRHGGLALDQAFELVCDSSLWVDASQDTTAPDWPSLAWRLLGAPDSAAYDRLPAALAELTELHSGQHNGRPESTLHVGSAFTIETLRAALDSQDAVHLATHLVLSPTCNDPEVQAHGLLLANDQIVCASTIRDWKAHPPLVYLGACASGSGMRMDGEGQLGLARALQAGGTRNLVVTLWPVSDAGSAAFAKEFHAALAQGSSPSTATATARTFLRQQGHPMRDWAGFMHLGQD